jgi:tetratricopeptide (TPR) repeat protein
MAGRGVKRGAALMAAMMLAAGGGGAAAAAAGVRQKREKAAVKLVVPPDVEHAVEQIYEGNPDAALRTASSFEKQHPEEPLGYLLEAEARWWKLYCAESEIRYGMVEVWKLPKEPEDPPYLDAAHRAVELAEAELKKGESARAELWAGMAYALEARIYGLRDERRATAHAGVRAREHLLKASELDPALADAYTGLGLYNYYVDALSPLVKLLRFFLGIPGGSKKEGVRQLRRAMEQGQLTAVEARFYLAKNLRTYDHKYAEALEVAEPLLHNYPHNPIFLLLVANLEMELGRREQAVKTLSAIGNLKIPDAACAERAQRLARELLDTPR